MSNKKPERVGVTTRYTAEEKSRLAYLSKIFGVDISNVPRTLLWNHFGSSAEVQEGYQDFLTKDTHPLPPIELHPDPIVNSRINKALNDAGLGLREATSVLNSAARYIIIECTEGPHELSDAEIEARFADEIEAKVSESIHEYVHTLDTAVSYQKDEELREYLECNFDSLKTMRFEYRPAA